MHKRLTVAEKERLAEPEHHARSLRPMVGAPLALAVPIAGLLFVAGTIGAFTCVLLLLGMSCIWAGMLFGARSRQLAEEGRDGP